MELVDLLLQRRIIITLAVIGAAIATLGSYLGREASRTDPRRARLILRLGYGITWTSVALFIVAGFMSAY